MKTFCVFLRRSGQKQCIFNSENRINGFLKDLSEIKCSCHSILIISAIHYHIQPIFYMQMTLSFMVVDYAGRKLNIIFRLI